MAIMNYETPGVMKIDFEDNIFVITGAGRANTRIKEYIESRGGVVKNDVTETTNYLIYGDGREETEEYKKALGLVDKTGVKIFPMSAFSMLCRGKCVIEFGSYPFDRKGEARPIRWNILHQDGNKALLFSAYGLDVKPFHDKRAMVSWENCSLRNWLNEDFYNAAFAEAEKMQILPTKVETPSNPVHGTIGCSDTEDRVFLLSIGEMEDYLADYERSVFPTPFAQKQKLYTGDFGACWWRLRSPGEMTGIAAGVGEDGNLGQLQFLPTAFGYLSHEGDLVDYGQLAVCPATWVELK